MSAEQQVVSRPGESDVPPVARYQELPDGAMPPVGQLGGDTSRAGSPWRGNGPSRSGDLERDDKPDASVTARRLPVARTAMGKMVRRLGWSRRYTVVLLVVLSIVALVGVTAALSTGLLPMPRLFKEPVESESVPVRLRGADLRGADYRWTDLRGADLHGANLEGADLRGADLEGADLGQANLGGANLVGAALEQADLREANLAEADLRYAHLRWADLRGADLRGASLRLVDLEDVDLSEARLEGADLENVRLDGATLPDGSEWSWRTDLRRFTDPQYADFWQP
jgi:hypothetical protein